MNPEIKDEDFEGFLQKLPLEERRKLKQLLTKWQKYNEPAVKECLIENIETDRNHHNLVKLCTKSFAETALSVNSGYEFYFAEPLIEFGHFEEGNQNFDLLLFNEKKRSVILIECKTSIKKKASKTLKEIVNAIKLVENKLEYLSDIIGVPIEFDRIEYVLCVYDKDRKKIIESLDYQIDKSKNERENHLKSIKLWIYRPRSQLIQLYQNHSHNNPILTDMLLNGFGENDLRSQFELPYCITTHPYRIIKLAIIGDCYAKNIFQNVEDPKIIKINSILKTLEKNISLGMPQEQKRELISEKIEKIIQFGEKYRLLERNDKEEIRLICRGNDIQIVKNNIEDKFYKNWIQEKSEIEAKSKTIEEYKKKAGVKQLNDFPN